MSLPNSKRQVDATPMTFDAKCKTCKKIRPHTSELVEFTGKGNVTVTTCKKCGTQVTG